jgi:hypothetical protein
MAQIRASRRGHVLRVTISGRLAMADMGRLEHACAPALVSHPVDLELDLRRVTHADATATAVLERFSRRGAHILAATPPEAEQRTAGAVRREAKRS